MVLTTNMDDTIAAVATAPGEGGIGIIRISGDQAVAIAENLFVGVNGKKASQIASFQVGYGRIVEPNLYEVVDEVLLLVMKAPNSYTREDVAEIHCHGGFIPLQRILTLVMNYGARLAEPGEFTKRAFLNGRLDLTQAEAVIDIIRAKTDLSLHSAVSHLSGVLSDKIREIRHDILQLVAHLEASIDFPEEDIEEVQPEKFNLSVQAILQSVSHLLDTAQTGRILRDGLATVIIGKPNVGKSSLLNALLREKRAIVTDIPGTTRDSIEEYVNIGGVPLKIIDTAGIRETDDVVEKIGVEKAMDYIGKADLILMLLDSSQHISSEDEEILQLIQGKKVIFLLNKTDLPCCFSIHELDSYLAGGKLIPISLKNGIGLAELETTLVDLLYQGGMIAGESALVTNVRHVELLTAARNCLSDVLLTVEREMPVDCMVIDLRNAWELLGQITGDTLNEDIINQIFSQFCIGK